MQPRLHNNKKKKNTCFFFRSDSSNAQRSKFFLNSVLLFSIKCNRACFHSFRHWMFLNFFRLLSIKYNRAYSRSRVDTESFSTIFNYFQSNIIACVVVLDSILKSLGLLRLFSIECNGTRSRFDTEFISRFYSISHLY